MKRSTTNIAIIFLLTAATIVFEISLSRLFSYLLSFHFVLIIIAFSILGLGIGQITYAKYSEKIDHSLLWWMALPSVTMFLSFALLLVLSQIGVSSSSSFSLPVFILLSTIPFIAIGIVYAHIFETDKRHVSTLYALDLIGAATGALASVFLLNAFGLAQVVAIAIGLLLLALIIALIAGKNRFSKILVPLVLGVIFLMGFATVDGQPCF